MTTATFLSRQRRVLAICAVSVLLHVVAFGWLGGGLGAADGDPFEPAPQVIHAELRAPPPAAAVAPAPVIPAAPKPPPPAPASAPAAAPAKPEPVPEPVAQLPEEEAEDDMTPAAPGAQSLASDSELAPTEPTAEATPAPAAVPAPLAARYKVSLPPSADLVLDVTRTDAKGDQWSGQMDMSWKKNGAAYSMKVDASISMLFTRINLLTLTSEGAIDEGGGIAPRLATEKRRGRAQTATHFDAAGKRITFSASERSYELLAGAQDKATVPIQLAGIARADSGQLAAGIDILVGEDKDAAVFNFVVVGQETIETGLGRLATWHLSRPPRPGAYNSRLEVWLAPSYHWYPVRLRNTEGNGAVTTQTIRKLVITDTGH